MVGEAVVAFALRKTGTDDGLTPAAVLEGFSQGRISRRDAERRLGVEYSELLERLADAGLTLPELPPARVDAMAGTVADLLARRG